MPEVPWNQDFGNAPRADLTDQGASRASQDQSNATAPRDGALQGQVRKDLEETARLKQSTVPGVLAGAERLLACPEVLRRAGPSATKSQLQDAAHAALNDAVAAIPLERDKLIAQAVLAATDQFEGSNVEQRKRTLEDKHGITANIFKNRRPSVLDFIVDFLHQQPESSTRTVTDYHQALNDIYCLAMDAAHLSLVWRSCLFISAFDRELAESGLWPQATRNWLAVIEPIHAATFDLIISAGYCFDEAPYSKRARIARNLPTEVLTEFSAAIEEIYNSALPFLYDPAKVCRDYFGQAADLLRYRRRRHSWGTRWLELANDIFLEDSEPRRFVDPLVSACKDITDKARDWLSLDMLESVQYHEAVYLVANYYGVQSDAVVKAHARSAKPLSLEDYLIHYLKSDTILSPLLR